MRESSSERRERLRDRTNLKRYLQESLQKGPASFYMALREAVQARDGGFVSISRKTGLGRASLYKALCEDGNPSYITICKVLEALGVDLQVATAGYTENPMYTNDTVRDKGGSEYSTLKLPVSALPPANKQDRFRAIALELFSEADATVRQPGMHGNPDKAQIAELIAAKHRRIGLKV